jgi:MFS family permease
LVAFALEEKPQAAIGARLKEVPTHSPELGSRFRWYLAALVLFTLGNSSDAFLLVRSSQLGVSENLLPLLWCLFHLVKTGSNLAAGHLSDRIGPRPLLVAGWLAYGAVYLGFALATLTWHAWAIFLIYGLVYSLTEPAAKAMVAQLVPAEQKGLAFGWFHSAIGIAALPASLLFGWLYERFGVWAAFGSGASLAVLAAGLLAISQRTTPPQS